MQIKHAVAALEKLSKKEVIAIVPLENGYYLAMVKNASWFHLGYFNPKTNAFLLAPNHNTDKDFSALMNTMQSELEDIYGKAKE